MTENIDSERQPLLPHHNGTSYSSFQTETPRRSVIIVAKRKSINPLPVILYTLLLIVCASVGLFYYARGKFPSAADQIQNDIRAISSLHIDNLHVDGWRQYEKDPELNNDGGKYLQVSSDIHMAFNYDLLDSKASGQRFSFISQNVIRSLCIGIDGAELFDGPMDSNFSLGRLIFTEPLCLSLMNGTMNDMHATVLLQPHMGEVWGLIKKLWFADGSLNLWLNMNVTLYKPLPLDGVRVKVAQIHNFRYDLDVGGSPRPSLLGLINDIKTYLGSGDLFGFESFAVRDIENGFGVSVKSKPINPLQNLVLRQLSWLDLGTAPLRVPTIEWSIKLPDCSGDLSIDIPSMITKSRDFALYDPETTDDTRRRVEVSSEITAPLPDNFFKYTCPPDGRGTSTDTPLARMLSAILNIDSPDPVKFRLQRSHVVANETETGSAALWDSVLNNLLLPIDFSSTVKYNFSKLIKEININDMRLTLASLSKHNNKTQGVTTDANSTYNYATERLGLTGSITVIFDLSFYNLSSPHQVDHIRVTQVRGNLDVFHHDKHMLSIPMQNWTNSTSRMYYSKETKTTLMEVQFAVDDTDIKIIDGLELTRCGNEIMFKGSSRVTFNGTTDFTVDSILGSFSVSGIDVRADDTTIT